MITTTNICDNCLFRYNIGRYYIENKLIVSSNMPKIYLESLEHYYISLIKIKILYFLKYKKQHSTYNYLEQLGLDLLYYFNDFHYYYIDSYLLIWKKYIGFSSIKNPKILSNKIDNILLNQKYCVQINLFWGLLTINQREHFIKVIQQFQFETISLITTKINKDSSYSAKLNKFIHANISDYKATIEFNKPNKPIKPIKPNKPNKPIKATKPIKPIIKPKKAKQSKNKMLKYLKIHKEKMYYISEELYNFIIFKKTIKYIYASTNCKCLLNHIYKKIIEIYIHTEYTTLIKKLYDNISKNKIICTIYNLGDFNKIHKFVFNLLKYKSLFFIINILPKKEKISVINSFTSYLFNITSFDQSDKLLLTYPNKVILNNNKKLHNVLVLLDLIDDSKDIFTDKIIKGFNFINNYDESIYIDEFYINIESKLDFITTKTEFLKKQCELDSAFSISAAIKK